jgi:FkbM family methyltransferase
MPPVRVGDHLLTRIGGIWLPCGEERLAKYLGQTGRYKHGMGTYQYRTLARCVELLPPDRRRECLDVGAHVGLWSMHLALVFEFLRAFEPSRVHAACFRLNAPMANVHLWNIALGDMSGAASLTVHPAHSMLTHLEPNPSGTINVLKMDDVVPADARVDFVKIDTEDYELRVLRGGAKTIERCRPLICIEQKGHDYYGESKYAARELLEKWGYVVTDRIADDFIMASK